MKAISKTVSVAPMMDCTDKHDRYFLRLISKNVMLYTEMIVANAIIRGDKDFLLKFNLLEKPLALQIGGSVPKELAEAVKIAENYGYDLEGSLAKHPIKELENPDYKENIMDSIKKGNRQSVTFTINGEDHKRYVEANPKFKAINIYNRYLIF